MYMTIGVVVFLVQLICCVYLNGIKKYWPTLAVAALMALSALLGGILGFALLAAEAVWLGFGGLAIVLYRIVLWTKK